MAAVVYGNLDARAGGSMRDVMNLAGHKNLQTIQGYVEQDDPAQKVLMSMLHPGLK